MAETEPADDGGEDGVRPRSGLPVSRRGFLAGCVAGVGAAVAVGYHASMVEPFWLDVHEETLVLPKWPAALTGLRVAHLTDMHLDEKMPPEFPIEVARRVREELKPDLVAFTGDLTTHNPRFLRWGSEWLASFGVPTFVCLGNHDYDPETSARVNCTTVMATDLERELRAAAGGERVKVLRNTNAPFEFKSKAGTAVTLHVAGVEDWYTGTLDAARAVAGVPEGAPRLMLCHNPDAFRHVDRATDGGLILSGHTHGGQICLPWFGPPMVPLVESNKVAGRFTLEQGSTMYVSRGVGFLARARLLCRPEVVVHRIVGKA